MSNVGVGPSPDLAVIEFDGDLVIYDEGRAECHVLTGGAVVVWAELESGGTYRIVERVAARTGTGVEDIGAAVNEVVTRLGEMGLLQRGATDT